MKTTITKLILLCCFLFSIGAFAQGKLQTDSIKVYGNCSMCKATIEGALKRKMVLFPKTGTRTLKY